MPQTKPPPENIWLSLGCNVALPALVLGKGSRWVAGASPATVLVVALAFPVIYFAYDFFRRKKANVLSMIGFAGTLLTGGLGLLQMDPFWLAIKEAAVPLLIGVAVVLAEICGRSLVRVLLLNDTIFDLEAIDRTVAERGTKSRLEQALRRATWLLSGSFVFSSALNFLLARWIVKTHPAVDATAFNQELGQMTLWSWPVIVLPMMVIMFYVLFSLLKTLRDCSGLPEEDLLRKKK